MPNFITKLYGILESEVYVEYIEWSEHGNSFIIKNSLEFSAQVLAKLFKHANFVSFIRQLNLYNFHKMNRSYHRQNTITEEERAAEPREFFHENFLRGRADLLKLIERKLPNQAYLKMQKKLEVNKGKNFSPKTIASITPQASFNSLNFNNDVDFKEEEELSIKDLVSLNKSLEYRVNYLEDKIEEINEKLYRKLKNENYNRFGEERHNESYYARSNSENKFKNQKKIVLNEYNIDEMKEQTVERAVGEVESPAKEYQVNKTLPYYRHRDDTILTAETLTKSYKTSRFDFGGWGES